MPSQVSPRLGRLKGRTAFPLDTPFGLGFPMGIIDWLEQW